MLLRAVLRYEKIDSPDRIKFNNICDDFDLLTKKEILHFLVSSDASGRKPE